MRRALASTLLATMLVMSGCTARESKTTATMPAEPPAKAGAATPIALTPAEIPAPAPTPAPAPAPAPVPEPPKPAIKWFPRGIGLPLVSDDPEAKGKKVAMLTFDDGPSNTDSTARILDILKAENVHAVFFVTGNAMKHKDLIEREFKEGHLVAVHTVNHANMTKLSEADQRKEVEPLIALIQEVTGAKPKYFRPPYGAYNPQVQALIKGYGMDLINWTDGSLDWDGLDKNGYKDPQLVVKEVMKQLYPGAVILMHDIKSHTADALPDLIKTMRSAGYEFVTLPQ